MYAIRKAKRRLRRINELIMEALFTLGLIYIAVGATYLLLIFLGIMEPW